MQSHNIFLGGMCDTASGWDAKRCVDENRLRLKKHFFLNRFCFYAGITAYLVMARESTSI